MINKKFFQANNRVAGIGTLATILVLGLSACGTEATATTIAPTTNTASDSAMKTANAMAPGSGDSAIKTMTAMAPGVNAANDGAMKTMTAMAPDMNAAGDGAMKTMTAMAPGMNAAGDSLMKTATALAPTINAAGGNISDMATAMVPTVYALQTQIAQAGNDPLKLLSSLNGVLTGSQWDQSKILAIMTPAGQSALKSAGGPAQYFGETKPADSITPELALPGTSGDKVTIKTNWQYSDHSSKHTITFAPVNGIYMIDSVTKN